MNSYLKQTTTAFITTVLIALSASSAWSAPGTLANAPLTATRSVEPNVHITYDDSFSMFLDMLLVNTDLETFLAIPPAPQFNVVDGELVVDGRTKRYWHPFDNFIERANNPFFAGFERAADGEIMPDAQFSHPGATWDDHLWIFRTPEINALYYNPEITYEPWQGVDESGNRLHSDANPEFARLHPTQASPTTDLTAPIAYLNVHAEGLGNCNIFLDTGSFVIGSGGCIQDLFLPVYYKATDSNGNGRLDSGDEHRLIKIQPDTPTSEYSQGRTYAEEIQNFANWFQYYRKREFTAKAAIGAVIQNSSGIRMGLDAFDVGHKFDLSSMNDLSNKTALLRELYAIESQAFTPTREALIRVGEMFRQSTTVAGVPPPILPVEQGGECQQNFNILMTDGVWTEDANFSSTINNADEDSGQEATDINLGNNVIKGFDGTPGQSIDGGNYADGVGNTLADIAMHYYETDLRALGNKVPTTKGIDEAPHQHLVNYSVGFGVQGSLDVFSDPATANNFAWTDPFDTTDLSFKVDDLWHAAYNSRGKYLSARNPEQLRIALTNAINDITDRIASSSSVSVTSARLTTDSVIYRSIYNTSDWTGTISALPIANLALGVISNTELWNAANVLDRDSVTPDNRTILTYNNTSDPASPKDGVAFRWSSLTEAMKADLRVNPIGDPGDDELAQARLAYLRGDRSNEGVGLGFRARGSRLGDIVNSGPVFVKEATLAWPDGLENPGPDDPRQFFPAGDQAYSAFQQSIITDNPDTLDDESRQGVIYVGANDGMIHGFRESDGAEVLAYIPSNLFSTTRTEGLHYLTHINYQHRFYNDLTPTVSDVYIPYGDVSAWRTILIAGQGAGGRGYSMLDITDPSIFSENNAARIAMWEFSNRTNADLEAHLGYTFSQPQVGITNDGEWVVIFGNGYNSPAGKAILFVVKIVPGLDGTWEATDYVKIDTGVGTTGNKNGLGTPALADLDGNGTVDRVYAGDLRGNLWAFNLSSQFPSVWDDATSIKKLFSTRGNRPITTQPAISRHPTIGTTNDNEPNIMVTFGSGQLLANGDLATTNSEYFYGVWDKANNANLTYANLQEQTTTETTVTGVLVDPGDPDAGTTSETARTLTNNPVDYASQFGWYINLPTSGERAITDPIIRTNVVFFNTLIPPGDICAGSASGFRFAVDLASGGPPADPVIDINRDGVVDDNDRPTTETNAVVAAIKHDRALTDDTITENHLINQSELIAIQTAPTRQTGRLSWQELLQQ